MLKVCWWISIRPSDPVMVNTVGSIPTEATLALAETLGVNSDLKCKFDLIMKNLISIWETRTTISLNQ